MIENKHEAKCKMISNEEYDAGASCVSVSAEFDGEKISYEGRCALVVLLTDEGIRSIAMGKWKIDDMVQMEESATRALLRAAKDAGIEDIYKRAVLMNAFGNAFLPDGEEGDDADN